MSDDLVKELRFWNGGHKSDEKMAKAADRIEQLEAALKEIVSQETPYSNATVRRIVKLARAALGEKKDD